MKIGKRVSKTQILRHFKLWKRGKARLGIMADLGFGDTGLLFYYRTGKYANEAVILAADYIFELPAKEQAEAITRFRKRGIQFKFDGYPGPVNWPEGEGEVSNA